MSDDLNPYPGNLKHHRVDPLLSDEQVMDARAWPPEEVRHYYEAAIAQRDELIQRLVDALQYLGDIGVWYPEQAEALNAAEEAGFKPSDQ